MRRSRRADFDFLEQSFALRTEHLAAGFWSGDSAPHRLPTATLGPAPRSSSRTPADIDGPADSLSTVRHALLLGGRVFTVDGTVVSCACPDCGAPMNVRLWLGLAECWRCRCVVELGREQLAELAATGTSANRPNPGPDRASSPSVGDWPVPGPRSAPTELPAVAGSSGGPDSYWLFGWLPAWLASMLLHILLIILLAVIVWVPDPRTGISQPLELILGTFVNDRREEGGEIRIQQPDRRLADEVLPAPDLSRDETESRIEQGLAAELLVDPAPLIRLPDLAEVRRNVTAEPGTVQSLAIRDPRIREEIVRREGGTTQTEAAVARGLRWLASVQNADGSWSLENYDRHASPGNRGDSAGTGLALLPFLGAGQTHELGIHKETVSRGLAWLIRNQKSDGDLRINFPGQAGMYAHGQCAIVLCEAYAMTGDERLREPAQRAIDFIVKAQHSSGGWRYQPGQTGDTSVLGWQLMALQSARESGTIRVDPDVLQRAEDYLDSAGTALRGDPIRESGSLYRYRPREGQPTASMTAEAILCRMYLGWKRDDPRTMRAIRWLVSNHLPAEGDEADIYYWYYASQALHHYGGREWEKWNRSLRDRLVSMQLRSGPHPGSFDPADFLRGAQGERIFTTSFALCILEVYYRRLPLFHKLDL